MPSPLRSTTTDQLSSLVAGNSKVGACRVGQEDGDIFRILVHTVPPTPGTWVHKNCGDITFRKVAGVRTDRPESFREMRYRNPPILWPKVGRLGFVSEASLAARKKASRIALGKDRRLTEPFIDRR